MITAATKDMICCGVKVPQGIIITSVKIIDVKAKLKYLPIYYTIKLSNCKEVFRFLQKKAGTII